MATNRKPVQYTPGKTLVVVFVLLPVIVVGIDEIFLDTSSPEVCSRSYSYQPDAVYQIRAPGSIHGGRCMLTFSESTLMSSPREKPCFGLCVNVTRFLPNCDVEMAYFDGIDNIRPKEFNCHEFPPVLWCSDKNDMKISFSELSSVSKDKYDIIIRVKVVCRDIVTTTTAMNVKRTEIQKRDIAIIVGSLVGTISFLFVIFWISYCCIKQKRQSQTNLNNTNTPAAVSRSQPSTAQTYQSIPENATPPKQPTDGETRVKEWYTMQDMMSQPPYMSRYSPPPYSSVNEPPAGQVGTRYAPFDKGQYPHSEYSFRPIAHGESTVKDGRFLPDPDRPAHSVPPRHYDPTQLSRPYDRGPPYQPPRMFPPPPYGAKQYLV